MMRTEMSCPPVSPKRVSGDSGRLDKDKTKSAGDASDEKGGDFSSLLLSAGVEGASVSEAAGTQSPSQETVSADTLLEGKNRQIDPPPVADEGTARLPEDLSVSIPGSGLDPLWLAGMQVAAGGGLKGVQTGLNKGVNTVGATLGGGLDPASLAAQTAQTAQGQDRSIPTPGQEGRLGDVVSSRSSPLLAHGQSKLSDLKTGDSKNRTSLAVDAEASLRSDVFVKLERNPVASTSTNASTLDFLMQHMGSKTPQGGEGGALSSPSSQLAGGGFDGVRLGQAGISASTEMAVSHQVNYWMGRDVQSAELKLEGLGQSPVEVSITMQGQEARVAFRAEQVETRQMIEGTMPHLKELLKSEGLVLAGVSIGSASADGAFSQDRKPKPQIRRAVTALPELRLVEAGARVGSSRGGALDLFV